MEGAEQLGLTTHSASDGKSDKVIAWGGSTYALLLTETTSEDATIVAKHLTNCIAAHPELMCVSIGIANLEDTAGDNLIANAESSLRESLRTGEIVLNRLAID